MKVMRAKRLMTAEELYHLPKSEPGRSDQFYELDRGVLIIREPGCLYHSVMGGTLFAALHYHARHHHLGIVFGPDLGCVLRRDPDTVQSPDVAFIRTDRIPTGDDRLKFFEGSPDLAVEVISPSDRLTKVDKKVRSFLEFGSRIVWVVNPRNQTITVHKPNTIPYVLAVGTELDGEDVVPGFKISVAEVFRTYVSYAK